MSNRDWRSYGEAGRVIVGAAILAATIAVLVTVPHLTGGPSAEEKNAVGQQEPKRNWAPIFSPTEPYAPYHNADCQSPKDREEADLCQQWRVAEATEEAVAVAYAQKWWAVFQAWLTFFATLATAGAAVAAASAAISARKTVQHMDVTAKRELRAYLSMKAREPRDVIFGPGQRTSVLLTLKNVGKTPARQVVVDTAMAIREFPLLSQLPPEGIDAQTSRAVIHPGEDVNYRTSIERLLDPVSTPAIFTDGSSTRAYIYGRVDYIDIFNRPQWTTFRMVSEVPNGEFGFTVAGEGNDISNDD